MSFVDLATLTLHRRNELETRINSFLEKSDQAINYIKKLELQAQSLVQYLNCEPSELKDQFLSCMRQLDEYIYHITDINLALGKLEETQNVDFTPVLDITSKSVQRPRSSTFNIIDVLSDSTPSQPMVCQNLCPTKIVKKVKTPKQEQVLIEFSSTSCSSESVPVNKCEDKEVQCEVMADFENLTMNEGSIVSGCNLPAQSILQNEHMYPATIMSVDGGSFWLITEDPDIVCQLMKDMTEYYKACPVILSMKEVTSLHYCALYDEESSAYYRGFFIKLIDDLAEVFLVDTGELRTAAIDCVQPLAPQFCDVAPYARCCHLAGIDTMGGDSQDLMLRLEQFMKNYVGVQCHIQVDDNSSESLGVYVIINSKESLNELMVQELALIEKGLKSETKATQGPPELVDSNIEILNCPEYEDPVEAVTGYHNRDEADICKHYKGGPDKTCFKGARCKKKHVVKNPDGWTLDKVDAFVCRSLPLPAPDTWHKVVVTCVCHYNRVYVQFVNETEEPTVPSFGVVLPPTTLSALVRDMNSPASRMAYKPLTTMPALGEMVAALYPLDENWYRARVVNYCRADQNVEVMYVDYGNVVWVKENEIRALNPCWASLPAQALRARLAGVSARARAHCALWARAKRELQLLVHQRQLQLHVVGRDYDEITVELFDDEKNIAEELAKSETVELEDYSIEDDTNITQKLVVP
ncbi:uncharacterized protein krimp isoform X2 [Plodia interpunctella]|nr:uncharacterized protein LOC128673739 isoform X2 [Plodia interpunctella]